MKKNFPAILIVVFACTNQNKAQKSDIVPQDSMIMLMTKIHLLESKIKHLDIYPQDSAKVAYQHYEKLLFENFNTSQERYDRSLKYYIENTDTFREIYDAVVDTLMQHDKLEPD